MFDFDCNIVDFPKSAFFVPRWSNNSKFRESVVRFHFVSICSVHCRVMSCLHFLGRVPLVHHFGLTKIESWGNSGLQANIACHEACALDRTGTVHAVQTAPPHGRAWQNSENMRKLIFDDLHVFVHRDNFLSAMYLRPGSFKGLYRSLLLRIEPASISAREWRCWYLRLQARAFQAKPNVAKQDVKAGRYISGKGKLCWNIQTVFLVWEHCYSNARNLSLYSRNMQACACQWF